MKARVISAVVVIALLITVICLGETAIGIAVFILTVMASWEFGRALEKGGYRPVKAVSFAACIPVLYIALTGILPSAAVIGGDDVLIAAAVFIFTVLLSLF